MMADEPDRVSMDQPEVLLERMTWQEIGAAIAAGKTTAIIVAGSSEQHGPHLPEGTDAMIGEGLGVRLARKLGNALVAPVIRPGCSDHHLAFPGTVSIAADVLEAIIDGYIASLRRHGFKRFFIFSSHGGNFPVLTEMAKKGLAHDVVVSADLVSFRQAPKPRCRRFELDDVGHPASTIDRLE
jgi:creatinine amidohydrolase